jgi:hypothetical protein
MVGTRSRVYSNNVVVKRKYTKRKTVQSNRNRVISSDDEIVVENDPDLKPNELLIKNN